MSESPTKNFPIELTMALALGGGSDAMLEGLSSIGKKKMAQYSVLPKGDRRDVAALAAAGVKFLGDVDGDPLFQKVVFPPGWKIIPTSHNLWSYLLDAQGKRRAEIMYSAVPWDRDALFHASRRYNFEPEYEIPEAPPEPPRSQKVVYQRSVNLYGGVWEKRVPVEPQRRVMDPVSACAVIKDGYLTEIYRSEKVAADPEAPYRVGNDVRTLAEEWLNKNYPGWDDPAAYWDNS
jgi:hypothetical protein